MAQGEEPLSPPEPRRRQAGSHARVDTANRYCRIARTAAPRIQSSANPIAPLPRSCALQLRGITPTKRLGTGEHQIYSLTTSTEAPTLDHAKSGDVRGDGQGRSGANALERRDQLQAPVAAEIRGNSVVQPGGIPRHGGKQPDPSRGCSQNERVSVGAT